MARMTGEIADVIDRQRDSVVIYRFPGRIEDSTLRLGRTGGRELGKPWIL